MLIIMISLWSSRRNMALSFRHILYSLALPLLFVENLAF